MENSAVVDPDPKRGLDALERAIEIAGSQKALADRLDAIGRRQTPPMRCKQQNVWAWRNRDHKVPSEWARFVAQAVEFQVLPFEVRSDIYPNATDGLPHDFVVTEQFLKSIGQGKAA
jgi:DNA-binding transcriptional regulator YdaS (Cro superfamily)